MKDGQEGCLDPQLWHACAGGMVQMPAVRSHVYYFSQGHAEHSHGAAADLAAAVAPRALPALVLCRVAAVRFLADPDTDEVFTKIRLVPVRSGELEFPEEEGARTPGPPGSGPADAREKLASFAKTLTQSDANNGGGFSVPRYCAETIFPRLDYSRDPPVQMVVATDVHGDEWNFRHIYRGTPRRHLLTTGWSVFVNKKKLVAGDSIVFLRGELGELRVGIRRAKRVVCGEPECISGWNAPGFGGFSAFLKEEESKLMKSPGVYMRGRGKVKMADVVEAATLAANGQPFEVVYYPRACMPEFVVNAVTVQDAMRIQWCPGMRFKMPFEMEDSSRISWFMGTVSSVQVNDPNRWPNSPWRLLQVTWDEPDLLQNVKFVNPWLVDLVSSIPPIHLASFSPPRKKFRVPQHPDFSLDSQLLNPIFHSNPLGPSNSTRCCYLDNAPAGIQGARHAQFNLPRTDHQLSKLQLSLFQGSGFNRLDNGTPSRISKGFVISSAPIHDSVSCLLKIGTQQSMKKSNDRKVPHIMLFGKPILTEQQITLSRSREIVSPGGTENSSPNGNVQKTANASDGSGSPIRIGFKSFQGLEPSELGSEIGHCKVFMESEDVGRTIDLSVFESYEELYGRLADMFGIEKAEIMSHLCYQDAAGVVKRPGDEPFSEFTKVARRLTIITSAGSNNVGRLQNPLVECMVKVERS